MYTMKELQAVVVAFAKAVNKMFLTVKEIVSAIVKVNESHNKKLACRTGWHNPKDTRLKSQVTNNKPRKLVRKIIK